MNELSFDPFVMTMKSQEGDFITGYFVPVSEYERLFKLNKNIQQSIDQNKEFLTWETTKKNPRQRVTIENKIRELEVFYEY